MVYTFMVYTVYMSVTSQEKQNNGTDTTFGGRVACVTHRAMCRLEVLNVRVPRASTSLLSSDISPQKPHPASFKPPSWKPLQSRVHSCRIKPRIHCLLLPQTNCPKHGKFKDWASFTVSMGQGFGGPGRGLSGTWCPMSAGAASPEGLSGQGMHCGDSSGREGRASLAWVPQPRVLLGMADCIPSVWASTPNIVVFSSSSRHLQPRWPSLPSVLCHFAPQATLQGRVPPYMAHVRPVGKHRSWPSLPPLP